MKKVRQNFDSEEILYKNFYKISLFHICIFYFQ